ncbi:MAG: hypothetical protein Q9195_000868 [Heterodermia aff. obscurata]
MPSPSKLSSLLERDESPPNAQPSIDTLISSPVAPPNTIVPQQQYNSLSSELKTPQTATRKYAGLQEMHPSKVHQSTNRPQTMGLGLRPDGVSGSMAAASATILVSATEKATPTKSKGSLPSHMSSPGFDFNFHRPESDLSEDAQKIMEGVREQAARIKARMQEERDKQQYQDGETDRLYNAAGRKIAKAKGKSGRFSDVHKNQFKKMDSIANHASAWKNNVQTATTSLKRSGSKAGLDEPPQVKRLPKSASSKSLRSIDTDRLENTAAGKRTKRNAGDDTSTNRSAPHDADTEKKAVLPTPSASTVRLPSAITTPTKASLARALSVKSSKASMIPSLGRSNSTKTLASPAKSEGSNKYKSSLARFGNVKSILSRHQPKFSDDPQKIAAGTHLPIPYSDMGLVTSPPEQMGLNKELPNIPGAFPPSEERAPHVKRVVFTPSTKASEDVVASVSPSKGSTHKPQNQSLDPNLPSDPVKYPSLVNSPNITHRHTKTRDTPASTSPSKPVATPSPSKPTDFTFTSPRTLDFGAPASVSKLKFGTSTIRQVRPSGITTPLSPFMNTGLPAIAHGMANKKRKYADSDDDDDDDDRENVDPTSQTQERKGHAQDGEQEEEGPRAKKVKTMMGSSERGSRPQKKLASSRIPRLGDGTTPKGKGKGVLSRARLNMLARPKERR